RRHGVLDDPHPDRDPGRLRPDQRLGIGTSSSTPTRAGRPPGGVRGRAIMDHMMGGGMMWGMGLIGLLVIIVLILAAAALVKYLIFQQPRLRSNFARDGRHEKSRPERGPVA